MRLAEFPRQKRQKDRPVPLPDLQQLPSGYEIDDRRLFGTGVAPGSLPVTKFLAQMLGDLRNRKAFCSRTLPTG